MTKVGAGGTAVMALVASSALWGISWYPFRLLAAEGMSGLWAIIVTELVATLFCFVLFGRRMVGMRQGAGALVLIGLVGGATNTAFVLGTLHGEVLRVTLLLYLSPLWTLFLARWLLDEKIDAAGIGVVALALAGAAVMLGTSVLAPSAPAASGIADMLGLGAGFTYAIYNVVSRRASSVSVPHKAFAGSLGSTVAAALVLPFVVIPAWPQTVSAMSWAIVVATGLLLVLVVMLMQYGLMRLPAARANVILVCELVFAAVSAWWLANETPGMREFIGGLLIVSAGLLSSRIGQSDMKNPIIQPN
jgi:drug/metabolite transporter (DMT)-like permease